MNSPLRILHLEDDPADGELVAALLVEDGINCSIECVASRESFERAISQKEFDLIISDFTLPSFDGMSALSMARQRRPETVFIFVSGTIGEEIAVDSLKQGAVDYILKDRINRLPAAIRRAVREAADRDARRRAETRIREQAALLDKTMDAIFVHDLSGRITFWNKAAESMYGWRADEAIGMSRDQVVQDLTPAESENARRIVIERNEWAGEVRQLTRSGSEITVSSRCTLLRDALDTPIAILEVNSDVTDRKVVEAHLLRSQRLESLGSLAGGIAHDLNNVLSPIVMAAGLLKEQSLDEFSGKMVMAIQASAIRGTGLVRQILSFARGRASAPVALGVEVVVKEVVRLAQDTFPKSIRVGFRLAPDLPPILGDSTQLHQVLLNLAVNARDAMPTGGRLLIEAEAVTVSNQPVPSVDQPVSGTFVCLSVSDTGTGIAPEIRDRIFEPFFTTKDPDYGTGLGLSTVAGIVRNHGGFVEVTSAIGEGTTFRVFLPATVAMREEPGLVPTEEAPLGRGERILLVEDERAVRELIKEILESFHYVVSTASDGSEALALYLPRPAQFDVVLTDLGMSGMNGMDFIRALQKVNPDVTIICMSGLPEESQSAQFDRSTISEFIEKPFSTERLLIAVQNAISSRRRTSRPQ